VSYTVRYGEDVPERVPVKATRFGLVGAFTVLFVCAAAIGMAIPGRVSQLREALFPWTQAAVQEAFGEFRTDLQQGQSFREAFGEFCVEIIDNGPKGD